MLDRRPPLCTGIAALLTALILGACQQDADPVTLDSMSCSQIATEIEEARASSHPFDDGVTGRIEEFHQARPDCFNTLGAQELLDLELERQAESCPGGSGGWTASRTAGPTHDTPKEALATPEVELPDGEPEESFRQLGRVVFEYQEEGTFRGWALVEPADDGGWFVSRVFACGVESAAEPDR